jgi:ABC-type transport system involved in cytochrome c biogenesis permease component
MSAKWILLGVVLVAGAGYLAIALGQAFQAVDWTLLVLALGLFTLGFVGTVSAEPLAGARRAASVGAQVFGGATLVVATLLASHLAPVG